MTKQSLYTIAATLITLLSFQACQKGELAELQAAQLCLNTATAGTARNCVTNIASNKTEYAESLRCSAIFIEQGFSTPSQFIDALNAINNSSGSCTGGCSSTVGALVVFNFKGGTSIANEAFTTCSKANVKFYTQVSSLFKLGTLAKLAAGVAESATPTADQIKTGIGSMTDADVGSIVTSTYDTVCADTTNASAETKKYCTELSTAKSKGSTDDLIGACMKTLLQGGTCP